MNVTRASTTNHVTILYRPKVENHGHPLTIADDSTTIDLQTGTGVAARTAGSERLTFSIGDQPPSSPSEIGRVLRDRYVLVDRLGSGGKGTVFKALDRFRADLPEAEQYVAIKILHSTTDNREERLAKLRREFYRTQMLSHRNIVNVFELDRDGDVDFFTMEFLEGELLSRVVGRLQPLPMSRPQAWAIIREIGSGLEYAHSRNVVHADLKPHNIMITHSGEVRILDFGASSTSAEQSPEGRLSPRNAFSSVTPAYACCELLDGRSPDPSDDIYAFACLSYELLAGVHPFQRRRSTEARDLGIVPIRPLGLSRQQWQALTMGLSWHRAGRSISVRGWLNKLNTGRVAEGQLPRAHDLGSAPANPRPAVSFRAVALFAVLLICVTAWVSVARLAGRISGNDLVPSVAASTQLNVGPVPAAESVGTAESAGAPESAGPSESVGPPGKPPAASVAMDAGSRDAAAPDTPLQTLVTQSQAVNSIRRELNRSKPPTVLTSPLVVSASDYRVRSGERFAEIRVYRSSPLGSDTPFVWWTEAASAKPGIDYVHQGKAIQSFRKGKSSTSFFVKLVPKASRTQPEVFYIAISEAGRGASPDQVARAAVWLPTNNDQS